MILFDVLKASAGLPVDDPLAALWGQQMAGTSFVTEMQGAPPLQIVSAGKPLTAYRIYGNSVQDGTPTPENPIEVQSVGDKTKNLFSGFVKGIRLDSNTGAEYLRNDGATSDYIEVNNGHEYTLSGLVVELRSFVAFYDANKNYIRRTVASFYTSINLNIDDARYIRVTQYESSDTVGSIDDIDFAEFQLELGSEATAYEPYGYKIPVVVSGKNLFDVANTQWTNNSYLSETGKLVANNSWRVTDYIPVRGMVFTINNQIGNVPCICLYDANKNLIAAQKYGGNKVTTITSTEMAHYCRFSFYASSGVSSDIIQLELGTESTAYEPYHAETTNIYLDEPLASGDVLSYPKNILKHADGTAEPVTLPKIPTFDGTTVITVDTNIQPSNMYVKHTGKR